MGLLDLIFPKNCIQCGKSGVYLCPSCIAKVDYATTICPHCRSFSFYGRTHSQCMSEYSLNALVSLWNYEGVIKKGINILKYKFAEQIAQELGRISAIEARKFKLPSSGLFVPIPLYTTRKNWRGFNQAEELANVLGKQLSWPITSQLLKKHRASTPQAHLSQRKRLRNISGNFAVNKTFLSKIDVKTPLVIVDDVWTTGATIKEACKVLRQSGFEEVWGLTIARKVSR